MIKAVIFDMDGLLIDSEPLWVEAVVEVFNQAGVPVKKDITQQTMGLRVNESVKYWLLRFPGMSSLSAEILEERVTERVIELIREKGRPMKGAPEVVEILARKKLPLALASSSRMKVIDAVLEMLPVRPYLRVIRSAFDEDYGKPHPAVYINTAGELGVLPEECLAFEDSINGIISAKAAKMKCLAVPNPLIAGDKRFCLADMTLASLQDFRLELLDGL
ncbi:MAG: hexitol phosphatase HxpB [Dehalococcoidales bacterium]|nr:hexitol phosphatase HxpB [Dehalococcoidales bacterium]